MQIYSALQIGEYHLNNCEDYLFTHNIGDNKLLCAVMDGCTMGVDSYFVSTLTGKLLRKIARQFDHLEFYKKGVPGDINDNLKTILKELFKELKQARNQLMLEERELLTTLIILLVDVREDKGVLQAIGDGVVGINGELKEFEQDNKPDYIGYYLNEDFDDWYSRQTQKIFINSINDISIATDGITTFARVKKAEIAEGIDPVLYMVNDSVVLMAEDSLQRKLKTLEHVYGLKPTDDLAMIRIVNNN